MYYLLEIYAICPHKAYKSGDRDTTALPLLHVAYCIARSVHLIDSLIGRFMAHQHTKVISARLDYYQGL